MAVPINTSLALAFPMAGAASFALLAFSILAVFGFASSRAAIRPLAAPLLLAFLALVFLLRYPPERVRPGNPDWKASSLVDAMLARTRSVPPLRVAVIPRLSEFQPGLVLLECARRGVPADRALANGIWSAAQWEELLNAEFIVTNARDGLGGELPWQAFLRESLEASGSRLGSIFEPVLDMSLPDGSRITLWQRRAS